MAKICEIASNSLRLSVELQDRTILIRLLDSITNFPWCEAPYYYRIHTPATQGTLIHEHLQNFSITQLPRTLEITGRLAGLLVRHRFHIPSAKDCVHEDITIRNDSDQCIAISHLEMGLQRRITDSVGRALSELSNDRLAAIPFRIRPTDPPGFLNDFSIDDLVKSRGGEPRIDPDQVFGLLPSRHRFSEGWTWLREERALCIFKFSQETMEYSVLSQMIRNDGLWLRFGGVCMISGEPSIIMKVNPGETFQLGETRYQCASGGYKGSATAFRTMLDEKGCCFPSDYNPPVQWNELYDNPEWWVTSPGKPATNRETTRALTYTRSAILTEAEKAVQYSCEALYLDPGWDTHFGTLLWGEQWLGPLDMFIKDLRSKGLRLALHCALATWMGHPVHRPNNTGRATWPAESSHLDEQGRPGSVCLCSTQYMEIAKKRLLENCVDGLAFLMFDGNAWLGPCWSPHHGHPVPSRLEDHVQANIGLARAIHETFPNVIIEMHDPIAGGTRARWTPVYYKYGLVGSFNENWGFELMWNPIDDLRSGRSKALYYYNLACNVPLYLHIDLRDDNEHCIVLWWFASTCRHLGIGGTHANIAVAESQKHAMRRYRKLERFFKRGKFVGINDEIHLHVLPQEDGFVVNIFNLSDSHRRIEGKIPITEIGINADRWYTRSERWIGFENGWIFISCELPAWGTQLIECLAVQ